MANLIDGKVVSQFIRNRVKEETADFVKKTGITPTLAVVLVGEDPASQVYVRNKQKACAEVGICAKQLTYSSDMTEEELLQVIDGLNADPAVHGILVQLPLPKQIREDNVIKRIAPHKDVDAFHPENVGRLVGGNALFLPCTPAGITELLKYYGIETAGKHCVVIGRSNIVGKPMFHLMLQGNATVTVCHSKTQDLVSYTKSADILVVAIGKDRFVRGDMVKPGAVVIDVGINRGEDGKLHGDVDFDSVSGIASYITPVPGGVGPMTIAMLLQNTLRAAKQG